MADSITIRTADFLKAAYTPAKTANPKRSKHQIAKFTHIDGTGINKLYVSAPCHSTLLEADGQLARPFSINAKELYDLLKKAKTLSDNCALSLNGETLSFTFGATVITKKLEPLK